MAATEITLSSGKTVKVRMRRRKSQQGTLQRKAGNWTARYLEPMKGENGEIVKVQRRVILAPISEMTKREARIKLEQIVAPFNHGTFKAQSVMAFSTYLESKWRPDIRPTLKHSTRLSYEKILSKHIEPQFGPMRLCDMDMAAVQSFASGLFAIGRKWQTVHNVWSCLSGILQTAVDFRLIAENPATGVRFPGKPQKDEALLPSPIEFERFLAQLKEPTRTMVGLLPLTGLRIGELLALRVMDVDIELGTLHVRRNVYDGEIQTPKGESARSIPIGSVACWLLAPAIRNRQPEEIIFPNQQGHPLDAHNILSREIKPAGERWAAKYKEEFGKDAPRINWTWHMLKHIYGTEAQRQAKSPADFQRLARHASAQTTLDHYAHAVPEHLRAAQEAIEKAVLPGMSALVGQKATVQ